MTTTTTEDARAALLASTNPDRRAEMLALAERLSQAAVELAPIIERAHELMVATALDNYRAHTAWTAIGFYRPGELDPHEVDALANVLDGMSGLSRLHWAMHSLSHDLDPDTDACLGASKGIDPASIVWEPASLAGVTDAR